MYYAWNSVATSGAGTFTSAVGYASYNEGDLDETDVIFNSGNGHLHNNASYVTSISYNPNDGSNIGGSDYFDGWNLIGNPYPCALDWSSGSWTKTNIQRSIYFWNGTNYVYYHTGADDHTNYQDININNTGVNEFIPAMQSFFIKATAGSPALTIPADARKHSSNNMSKDNNDFIECSNIKLRTEYNNLSDELYIRFIEEATNDIDDNYDAYKMFSTTPQLPQIFSITDDTDTGIPITINSLPIPEITGTNYTSVPLGFVAKETGEYTITATELNNLDFQNIYLIDKIDDENYIKTDLLKTTEYTCNISEGEVRGRFYLFFFPAEVPTNLFENKNSTSENVNIYSNSNQIFINISSLNEANGIVEIYDMLGKCILTSKANSTFNTYTLSNATGTYLVKYKTNSNVYTEKVFIVR